MMVKRDKDIAKKSQVQNDKQNNISTHSKPHQMFAAALHKLTSFFSRKTKPDDAQTAAGGKPARKIKPAEKRLFHKPVTPVKIIKYGLLAILLTTVIVVSRFVYVTMIDPSAAFGDAAEIAPPTATPAATAVHTAPATIAPTPSPTLSPEELLALQADMNFMKDRVNILLTGIDYSEEREGRKDFRTDTILLLCIDFATGKVDLLSVPRDSYADIAFTKSRWKINGAYMSAGGANGDGFECLMETVSSTIGGIPVNYYIGVEMQAVKDIVDVIGGVWYDVDYEINMNGRHLDKGYQLLDGQAVLDYCRARKGITSGTDIDRIDRQQRLLMDVFRQMKGASLLQDIPEMYRAVQSEIYTNLNFEQITALALFALNLDLETECNRYTLEGEYMNVYNAMYYVLDHTYTENVMKDIFGENVTLNIDWTYSLSYVRGDKQKRDSSTASSSLSNAIGRLSSLVEKYKNVLSSSDINGAKQLISDAYNVRSRKNIDDMRSMTDKLNRMYNTLRSSIESMQPTPSPASTPAATPSPTPIPPPSPTPTAAPTATPTMTPTATPTMTPTATPTAAPTATPTMTPTAEPTATPSASEEPP